MRLKREAIHFLRRSGIILLNYCFNRRTFYETLGWLNDRYDFLASVFVAYPASENYADAYFSDSMMESAKWSPILCALLYQNGKWTLGMGISSLEGEIRETEEENLIALAERTERIRRIVGADYKTFAGILPGVFNRHGIVEESTEAEVTVRVVLDAIEIVKDRENLPPNAPLIILGGNGYIGSRLIEALDKEQVHSVEKSSSGGNWPTQLEGEKALLVNVADREALREYTQHVWSGLHLLNEVYPAPNRKEIRSFSHRNNSAYHVVGVEASAYPAFPKSYAGGIPCCAARPCEEMEAIIRKLN